jgi:hypothetical protein
MKEFRINDYITLKLEDNKTVIYVKGEPFNQCKNLLLNISPEKIYDLRDIDSIDEAAETLDYTMEENPIKYGIKPRVEFWAHCSNLQAWSEYNYDTRLLHCSLAFPLLEKLAEIGDAIAKRVFKEEIAERLGSGVSSVVEFLFKELFVSNYLTREEFLDAYLNPEDYKYLIELEEELGFELDFCWKATEQNTFDIEKKRIVIINLFGNKTRPKSLDKFKFIKKIVL